MDANWRMVFPPPPRPLADEGVAAISGGYGNRPPFRRAAIPGVDRVPNRCYPLDGLSRTFPASQADFLVSAGVRLPRSESVHSFLSACSAERF